MFLVILGYYEVLNTYPEPGAILVPDTFSHNDIF